MLIENTRNLTFSPFLGFRSHKCDQCHRSFVDRSVLESHRLIHSEQKPCKCDICGRCFRHKQSLKIHQKNAHNVIDQRSLRPRIFPTNKADFVKLKWKITEQYEYSCDKCSRVFRTLTALKMHHTLHTGEKPYSCDICGMSFRRRGNMYKHKKLHVATKDIECDICGKKFKTKPEMNIHRKRHDGIRPRSEQSSYCDQCGKKVRNSIMKKHLLGHVKVEVEEMNTWFKSFSIFCGCLKKKIFRCFVLFIADCFLYFINWILCNAQFRRDFVSCILFHLFILIWNKVCRYCIPKLEKKNISLDV